MKVRIIVFSLVIILVIVIAIILRPLMYKGTDNIVIVEDHNFSSLKDIVGQDRFEGKTVFVDIWGTTCKPCLMEFDYADELKEKYKNKPVDFLYLCSVDRVDHRVRWKDIIQKKQLRGYHVMIDAALYGKIWNDDLGDKIKNKFWIPHYFILKNGEIVVYKAAPPSSKEKLYNQIDSVLSLK